MSEHDFTAGVPNLKPTTFRTVLSVIGGLCGVGAFIGAFAVPVIRAPKENDFAEIQKAVQQISGDLREIKATNAERLNTEKERELRRDLELKGLRDLITRRR